MTSADPTGTPTRVVTNLESLFGELVRARFGGDAGVAAVVPLAGDASTRRYARLRLTGTGVPATPGGMIVYHPGIALC